MSVTQLAAIEASAAASEMSRELDRLQALIGERLRRGGTALSDPELADITDRLLNDAVRVALHWLGEGVDASDADGRRPPRPACDD